MTRRKLTRMVVGANALMIITGAWFYFHPDWPLFGGKHFYDESGPVTLLSLIQLAAIAVVTHRIHRCRMPAGERHDYRQPAYLWALISYGFWFLFADELLKIHENLDSAVHKLFEMEETGLSDRIDDVLIGLFGLIGLAVLYFYRREVARFSGARLLLVAGFVMLFIMVALDALTNRDDVLTWAFGPAAGAFVQDLFKIAEDSLKLCAEAAFLIAFHRVLDTARGDRFAASPPAGPGVG